MRHCWDFRRPSVVRRQVLWLLPPRCAPSGDLCGIAIDRRPNYIRFRNHQNPALVPRPRINNFGCQRSTTLWLHLRPSFQLRRDRPSIPFAMNFVRMMSALISSLLTLKPLARIVQVEGDLNSPLSCEIITTLLPKDDQELQNSVRDGVTEWTTSGITDGGQGSETPHLAR